MRWQNNLVPVHGVHRRSAQSRCHGQRERRARAAAWAVSARAHGPRHCSLPITQYASAPHSDRYDDFPSYPKVSDIARYRWTSFALIRRCSSSAVTISRKWSPHGASRPAVGAASAQINAPCVFVKPGLIEGAQRPPWRRRGRYRGSTSLFEPDVSMSDVPTAPAFTAADVISGYIGGLASGSGRIRQAPARRGPMKSTKLSQ